MEFLAENACALSAEMRALYQLKCVRLEKADVLQREVKVLFSKFFMRTEAPSVPGTNHPKKNPQKHSAKKEFVQKKSSPFRGRKKKNSLVKIIL